ncbi:MAG: molybdenum cofactor guanylyltransferase MobA [Geminicoccaceae bacterium]
MIERSSGEAAGLAAVLLAGGMARRMGGGDKAFVAFRGRPLIAHVIERMRPQVDALVINANGDPSRFREFGLPVEADAVPGFAGPLAGILAGMRWTLAHRPGHPWLLSVPTDTPFLPADLGERLKEARDRAGAHLACAMSADRTHPVVGLWDARLADDLERAMVEDDMRKIDLWTARFRIAHASFPIEPVDPFYNINRPGDLAEAAGLARAAMASLPTEISSRAVNPKS